MLESTEGIKVPFKELRSGEVEEILSRPPVWLLRHGISLFCGLFALIIGGCWFIKYPDTVPTAFTLTAVEAPRSVFTRVEGKLDRLMVRDGQLVKKGQALVFSESVANPEDVLNLGNDIENLSQSISLARWDLAGRFDVDKYRSLGELQGDYQSFTQRLTELRAFFKDNFYARKRELMIREVNDLIDLQKNIEEQIDIQKRDFELGKDEFRTQEVLHENKVIASLEFKKEKARLLAREMPLKQLSSALIQSRSAQVAKEKEILELDKLMSDQKSLFQNVVRTIQTAVENWKRKYIVVSPVSGRISFNEPWQEHQYLTLGQKLFTIEPTGGIYQGLIKVSQTNVGKLAVGQMVLIKLDGFPYREYGILEGTLAKISETSTKDSLYWGYVQLPNQLTTRYGRPLKYRHGLKGTADVVTLDRHLIDRLISTVSRGGQ